MYYVALLRGINVGGAKKVPMSSLKELFETLGYSNVSTYGNSGNVIFYAENLDFTSATIAIETVLLKCFSFEIKVTLRNESSIKKIVETVPTKWANNTDQRTDVLFLWVKYDSSATLQQIKTNPHADSLIYVPGAIIWNMMRINYSKSSMRRFIGSEIYKNMTARNINTVRKLALLLQSMSTSK